MSGRILPFEGQAHRDVERMLPWYANHTLDDDEAARVRAHLTECAACRTELASLRASMDVAPQPEDLRETDRGWMRMRERLQAARRVPSSRFDWRHLRIGWQGAPAWLQVALAAQFAFIVVLAAFVFRSPEPVDAFATLSASPAPNASHDTLLVVFDPRMTEVQLRALLRANHARIVDGPNATGAFLVATPPGQAELVRNAMRAQPGVSMAERLAPPE